MNTLTIGKRIKKVRKALDLTQQEFADQIGSKRNTIATYEMGRTEPSAAVVSLVCTKFNVSETWLRTGEEEMFLAKPTAALDALAVEHHLSNSDYALIEKYLALKPETRKAMTDYMREVVASITAMERDGNLSDEPAFPSSLSHGIPRTMAEVDEQADNFRSGLIMDAQHQQRQDEAAHTPTIEEQARAEAEQHTQRIYEQVLAEKKAHAALSSEFSGPSAGDGTMNRA